MKNNQSIYFALFITLIISIFSPIVIRVSAASLDETGSNHLISPEPYLNSDGSINITSKIFGTFDLSGFDVVLDDTLGPVLSISGQANAVAANTWEALAENGLNNKVLAMAVIGTDLYIGGAFVSTITNATANLNGIAKYSGGAWSALAENGLNNTVRSMAVVGTDLFVGGDFSASRTGATQLSRIAKYSGGAWSALAENGLNSSVRAMAVIGTDLYVGGGFTSSVTTATPFLRRIAKYDTTANAGAGDWDALAENGFTSQVYAMVVIGTDLYVGGQFFETTTDVTQDIRKIAKYSAGAAVPSWSALAEGGLNDKVWALAVIGTDLYVGGEFTASSTGATPNLIRIAKYDTTANAGAGDWDALAENGLDDTVFSMAVIGNDLYLGGEFTQTTTNATLNLNRIAKYSGDTWSALAEDGLNITTVNSMSVIGTDLYVGGDFTGTTTGATANLNRIAIYGTEANSSSTNSSDTSSSTSSNSNTPSRRTSVSNSGGSFASGKSLVILPNNFIPTGYSNCRIVWELEEVSNIVVGFTTGDAIYDISIVCDPFALSTLVAPITICFIPKNGSTANKQIFHQHTPGGAYKPLPIVIGPSGYVCGTTSQLSNFTLDKLSLPSTGFEPGVMSELARQPEHLTYSNTAMMLSVPKLDLEMPIVGVPMSGSSWDTSWLSGQAGFLQGTSFPTLAGNTVLTAHVWDATNQPGAFAELNMLRHGDQFTINAWGLEYTYEVRISRLVSSENLSVLRETDLDWVTLMTCESFNEASHSYLYRRVVQAVIVSVN
jgi:LPXTG-site transpeptidase (sortase) family protein